MSDTATRYAAALLASARGDGALEDRMRADLDALAAVAAEAGFRSFVDNPRIGPEHKAEVMGALADRVGAADATRRLLSLLAEGERLGAIAAICEAYGRLVDASRGRQNVTVTAAFALPEALEREVDARLTRLLGAGTRIRHRTDPDALGGLVVQIGSKVFDHSVRSHLHQLRQTI